MDHIEVWYTPDGEIDEPYELTLFSPKRGEWTVPMTGRDSMDSNPEFQMYWTRIPDFGIKEYDVLAHEDGWIARQVFGGTAVDGTSVTAHQVDFVTTDERCRVVRLEWYTDPNQWLRVWSVASGKPLAEVSELFDTHDGFKRLIADTIAGRERREVPTEPQAG
ncbi:hypothetical protein ACFUVV_34165 [Streptomyces sp. NPDC057376]|uniref:hypothetical protein n=1 Tax=Streptomyces sp. NPDC057376 TaxID=3346110 RepID=UPI00362EDB40